MPVSQPPLPRLRRVVGSSVLAATTRSPAAMDDGMRVASCVPFGKALDLTMWDGISYVVILMQRTGQTS
jgi:hypothetical protein